ncbi:GNAT family N-acetyltransferase [Pseudomonas chlororaphis]|uniref:GNAT family N-acetyltransferase n=1 Tax=Pseudomonas chlororaphis TaxID=587753 RepID=UPI002D76AC5E|nr:GNAT family N-acetyltransferase [Pseudomonas chlororaphis]
MTLFDPLRDFFQRRAALQLTERATRLQLLTQRTESQRGHFVFPGTDTLASIEVAGQRVGYVDYGINPLGDRVYINMIEVQPGHQRRGIGLAVLWQLWLTHQVPIVPLYQYGSSYGFWNLARRRFAAAGALIEEELRGFEELELAKQRWQHLVPEPEHERLIRELKASPEWPAIEARIHAGKPA